MEAISLADEIDQLLGFYELDVFKSGLSAVLRQ